MQIRLCTRRIIEAIFSSFTYSYLLLSSASAAAPCERDSDAPNTNTCCLMRGRCLEFSRRLALTPSLRSVWSSKQLGPVTTKRCVPWTPVAQAAKANSSRIDVAAARQRDTKQLARAFRSVPVVVVTLSKNSSRPAEDLSGERTLLLRHAAPLILCGFPPAHSDQRHMPANLQTSTPRRSAGTPPSQRVSCAPTPRRPLSRTWSCKRKA